MLLISGNLSNIVQSLSDFSISGCYWILIVALLLIPMSWLGTPKDFWWTAIVASVTTTIAAVLIVINLSKVAVFIFQRFSFRYFSYLDII